MSNSLLKKQFDFTPKSHFLLEAQAYVDWTVSNLPSFEQRLNAWMDANLYVEVENTEPNVPNNVLAIAHREHFPLVFNVEAGAYINTLRSALDILACSLVRRHCGENSGWNKFSFPISSDAIEWQTKSKKWKELKKALPTSEARIIEGLQPYGGGNKILYTIHQLDILRKHQRSLFASAGPITFTISGDKSGYIPLRGGPAESYNKTVVGLVRKGAPQPDIKFTPQVFFWEIDLMLRRPVITSLYDFTRTVSTIIRLFDIP